MNIELTTASLRNICRICFNKGDVNIWLHKVRLPPPDAASSTGDHGDSDGDGGGDGDGDGDGVELADTDISVCEMMQIFDKWEHKILDLNTELKLICQMCLDEFLAYYLFYQKLEKANQQVKRLYKSALEIECEHSSGGGGGSGSCSGSESAGGSGSRSVVDVDVGENCCEETSAVERLIAEDGYEGDVYEAVESPVCDAYDGREAEGDNDCITEDDEGEDDPPDETDAPRPAAKRKIAQRNPNIVLTGAVSKMLTHVNSDEMCEEPSKRPAPPHFTQRPAKKKARLQRHRPRKKNLADASLVVAQFMPSMEIAEANELVAGHCETGLGAETQLRTMEYTAVEIKVANIDVLASNDPNNPSVAGDYADTSSQSVYVCKYCPKAYSAPHYLIAHVRKSHVCKHCMQAFAKVTDLFEHVKQMHSSHKCMICSKELSSHSNLRVHIKRVHGIKLPTQVALLDYHAGTTDEQSLPEKVTLSDTCDSSQCVSDLECSQ